MNVSSIPARKEEFDLQMKMLKLSAMYHRSIEDTAMLAMKFFVSLHERPGEIIHRAPDGTEEVLIKTAIVTRINDDMLIADSDGAVIKDKNIIYYDGDTLHRTKRNRNE